MSDEKITFSTEVQEKCFGFFDRSTVVEFISEDVHNLIMNAGYAG